MMDDDKKEESRVKIEPLPIKDGRAQGRPRKYEEGSVEHRKKTDDKITMTDKRRKALKKLHVMNALRNEEKRKAKKERMEKAESLLNLIENSSGKLKIQDLEEQIQVESKKKQGVSNEADFYRSPIDNEEDLYPSAVRYNTPIEVPDKIPVIQNDTLLTQPFGSGGKLALDKVYMNEKEVIKQRKNLLKSNNDVPYTDINNEVEFLNGSNVFPSRRSGFELAKASTNQHQYVIHNQHPFSINKSNATSWQHPPKTIASPEKRSIQTPIRYAYNPFHQFR